MHNLDETLNLPDASGVNVTVHPLPNPNNPFLVTLWIFLFYDGLGQLIPIKLYIKAGVAAASLPNESFAYKSKLYGFATLPFAKDLFEEIIS